MTDVKLWAYIYFSSQGIAIPMEKLSALLGDGLFLECGWSVDDVTKYKKIDNLPTIRILTDDQVKTILVRDRLQKEKDETKEE